MATPVGTAAPPPAGPTPVAAYSFDEGGGSSVADASGRGNVGSVVDAAWTTAGKFGGALSFNGSSSMVSVPDSSSLDLTSGMTLEAWVNPSFLGSGWRTAVLKEQPGELVYALYANSDSGQPAANVFVGSDTFVQGGGIPLNAWSFLAATYDGTTLRLYVNGSQVASQTIGGSILTSGGALRIGGNNIWGEWFQGRIDNVRVYNRALTQAQLQADSTTPVGP
jgi:hypothetical protein